MPGAVCSMDDVCPVPSVRRAMSGGKSFILKRVAAIRAKRGRILSPGVLKTASRWKMLEKPPLIVGRETTLHINCSRGQLICSRDESAAHIEIDADRERCNPKHGRVEGDPSTRLPSIFCDETSARSHPRWGFLCRSEWRAIARQSLRKHRRQVRPRWIWG